MSFTVIIPARYASTRFPGKPLAQIKGKTMLAHVYERAIESGAQRVLIATDDERINAEASKFGAEVCMTGDQHQSGTSRISEVIERLNIAADEIVVNVQGDEPFIPAANIRQVAASLSKQSECEMASLCYPISSADDLLNPNVVKVIRDKAEKAIYFSRSIIPFPRGFLEGNTLKCDIKDLPYTYLRHIGIYSYRAGFVKKYMQMPSAILETVESLEQLKVLENGFGILVEISAEAPPHGVDTPEDLEKLNNS